MKDIEKIEKSLTKLDEYIKDLESKKQSLEDNNLKKRMLINELKIINNEK